MRPIKTNYINKATGDWKGAEPRRYSMVLQCTIKYDTLDKVVKAKLLEYLHHYSVDVGPSDLNGRILLIKTDIPIATFTKSCLIPTAHVGSFKEQERKYYKEIQLLNANFDPTMASRLQSKYAGDPEKRSRNWSDESSTFSDMSFVSYASGVPVIHKSSSPAAHVYATEIANKQVNPTKFVPVWRHGISDEDRYDKLELYCNDLKMVKSLNVHSNEQALIFLSVNESGRTELLHTAPLECLKDVNSFVSYLKKAYGREEYDRRIQLDKIQRKKDESMHAFFARVIRLYYRSRNLTPLTLEELTYNEDAKGDRTDIMYHYLKGLRNKRVAETLKARIDDLTMAEVPKMSKTLLSAYGEDEETDKLSTGYTVNFTDQNLKPSQKTEPIRFGPGGCGKRIESRGDEDEESSPDEQSAGEDESDSDENQYTREKLAYNQCRICRGFNHWGDECTSESNIAHVECYNCNGYGHFSHSCPSA